MDRCEGFHSSRTEYSRAYDYAAAQTVVSSWVAANEELLHMWNSYAPADTGIAISTDVYSLIRRPSQDHRSEMMCSASCEWNTVINPTPYT